MSFLGLLVVAAVPLMSIAYLIGGVTIPQVLGGTALVLATGVCVATMCAAISTFTRRVQGATVLAYGLTIALALGTLLAYGAAAVIDRSRGIDEADPPAWIIALNPVAIVGDLVGTTDSGNQTSPFDAIKNLTDPDEDDQAQFQEIGGEVGVAVTDGGGVTTLPAPAIGGLGGFGAVGGDFGGGLEPVPVGDRGIPFWAGSLAALAALATVTLLRAARRLRTPAERER
jgi:hypothetical protein